jgi:hypothetical protein
MRRRSGARAGRGMLDDLGWVLNDSGLRFEPSVPDNASS